MKELAFVPETRPARLLGASQQLNELFKPEIRVPNDSAEKWFLDAPAQMNGYYGSSFVSG
jgi:hypothetical protein